MKAIPVLIQFHQMRQLKAAPSQAAIAMSWWSTEIAGCFTNSLAPTNKRVGVGMQNGAIFNMTTGTTRPAGWTSADAAGLPILPGLVRYDEVSKGAINHALRFTVVHSRRAYIAPARHFASSSTNVDYPPMGMRVRLKANFDISGFPASARVVLTANGDASST